MKSQPDPKTFFHFVEDNISESAKKWFGRIYDDFEHAFDRNKFAAAYAGVRRRFGQSEITFHSEDEYFPFERQLMPSYRTTVDEVGRACLLLRATACLSSEESYELIRETYQHGDNFEQRALLRTLPFFPDPRRYVSIAIEACRCNVKTVFEAIACDNIYPFKYFPDSNFNHMVLKSLFIGSPLKSVVGLNERLNPQLHQMVVDFVSEYKIAGRVLPADIALITPNLASSSHEAI